MRILTSKSHDLYNDEIDCIAGIDRYNNSVCEIEALKYNKHVVCQD